MSLTLSARNLLAWQSRREGAIPLCSKAIARACQRKYLDLGLEHTILSSLHDIAITLASFDKGEL